jgi:hypothetical protein
MTDEVAERIAQRALLSAGVGDDPELLAVIGGSKADTSKALQAEFTVPQLRERADRLGVNLTGLGLKEDIADAIAGYLHEGMEAAEAELEPEPDAEALPMPAAPESDGRPAPRPASNLSTDDIVRPLSGAGRFLQVRHVSRTLSGYGQGNGHEYLDPQQARDFFAKYIAAGYHLLFVQHLGIDPAGHMMLWAFGLANDPKDVAEYSELHHIVRTIGTSENAITGFQADEYISSYLADGWELYEVKQLGLSPSGINVLWVLVR